MRRSQTLKNEEVDSGDSAAVGQAGGVLLTQTVRTPGKHLPVTNVRAEYSYTPIG